VFLLSSPSPPREGVPGFPAKSAIWQGGKGRGILKESIFEEKPPSPSPSPVKGEGKRVQEREHQDSEKEAETPGGHCEH